MGKSYAGILGVIAFNVAVLHGMLHGGTAASIMLNAWIALLAFSAAGYVIGWIAEQIVNESIRANNEGKPGAASPPKKAA